MGDSRLDSSADAHRGFQKSSAPGHAARRALVAGWLFFLALTCGPGVAAPPAVLIDAPADLEAAGNRLREWRPERLAGFQRLIGLADPGDPIRVVLATEDSVPASVVPPWIAGYARHDAIVVLFPARVPAYPNSSLDELLGHEVAHVLIQRAAGGRSVPRWFNEGLAMLAEEAWDWGDRSRAAIALIRGGSYRLSSLDRRFGGNRYQVSSAYALSASFVRAFVRRYGRESPAEILARLAAGESFEAAFAAATGVTLAEAEDDFWRRRAFWSRWVPFATSPATLWIAVTLLALLAIKRRRDRNRALESMWAEEEGYDEETGESLN